MKNKEHVYFVGKADYLSRGRKDCPVEIEWGLEGGKFSMTGTIWNHQRSDQYSGGQNLEEIAKLFRSNRKVQRMVAIWRQWHLNDMQAGLPVQHQEIARREVGALETARKSENASRYFYDTEMKQPNWHSLCHLFGHDSHYSWACAMLKEAGLYEVPLPEGAQCTGSFPDEVLSGERGYRFGERWVHQAIPAEIIAEIQSWSNQAVPA